MGTGLNRGLDDLASDCVTQVETRSKDPRSPSALTCDGRPTGEGRLALAFNARSCGRSPCLACSSRSKEELSLREHVDRQLGSLLLPLLFCESGLRGVAAGAESGVAGIPGQELVQVPAGGEPLLLPLALLGVPALSDRPKPIGQGRAFLLPCGCHRRPIPDLDRLVEAGGGDAAAIGAVRHTSDETGVAAEGEELLAARRVPHPHRLVLAGGGDAAAIGAVCHACDKVRVTAEGEELLPACRVPHLDDLGGAG